MPASVHPATVPAEPKSTSSGCAAMTRTCWISVSLNTLPILRSAPAHEGAPRYGAAHGRARPPQRQLIQRGHHVLDAGVVLEPVHGQVLAVARVLEAAVRHLGHQRNVGVNPDATEVEAPGHPHSPAVVTGPHRRRQPVLGAIGPGQRLVLVAELLHRDDRAEYLVLDDLVVLAQPVDDAGLEEEAGRPGAV